MHYTYFVRTPVQKCIFPRPNNKYILYNHKCSYITQPLAIRNPLCLHYLESCESIYLIQIAYKEEPLSQLG